MDGVKFQLSKTIFTEATCKEVSDMYSFTMKQAFCLFFVQLSAFNMPVFFFFPLYIVVLPYYSVSVQNAPHTKDFAQRLKV